MKNNTNRKTDKKKLIYSILAIVVAAILLVSLSYAWFFNRADMATLLEIKPPSQIAILGPGGSNRVSMTLDYTNADKDADNKVMIRRVFCVQSKDNYMLEIAHTTNLKGLTFQLYEATEDAGGTVTDVTDGGESYTYKYDVNKPLLGTYINQDTDAQASPAYKYANNMKHDKNYETGENVQIHAEPLYWKVIPTLTPSAADKDKVTIDGAEYHRTYYVCEISWTETTKETDIFYILAKTV